MLSQNSGLTSVFAGARGCGHSGSFRSLYNAVGLETRCRGDGQARSQPAAMHQEEESAGGPHQGVFEPLGVPEIAAPPASAPHWRPAGNRNTGTGGPPAL